MPFPLNYHNEIDWSRDIPLDKSLFLSRMSAELERAGLQRVIVLGDRISFGGGTPQFSQWNILTALDEGEIEVTSKNGRYIISYDLSFRGLLITVSLGIPVLIGFFLLTDDSMPLWGKICLMVVAWLFVMGGNYLNVVLKFPALIKRVLKSI